MTEDTAKGLGVDAYEIQAWIVRLGSYPKERVKHVDFSEAYEMNVAHLFRLESGQYALVTEQGCSCYEPDGADVDLYPTRILGEAAFDKWCSEHKR